MADTDATPMTDADVSASAGPHDAEPMKGPTAGENDQADTGRADTGRADMGRADAGRADAGRADAGRADAGQGGTGRADAGRRSLQENAGSYGAQAADRARALVDTGKDKATGALGQLSTMLTDAAGQVDEKLGANYGDYARNAAGTVQSFADQLQAKNVDDLIDDARTYVQKSPAMAIGIAAALGFALARVVQSGIDGNKA